MFVSPASSNTDEIIIVLQSRKSLNGGVLKQIVENATEEEDLKDLINNAFSIWHKRRREGRLIVGSAVSSQHMQVDHHRRQNDFSSQLCVNLRDNFEKL